jgi:hypothetical protein
MVSFRQIESALSRKSEELQQMVAEKASLADRLAESEAAGKEKSHIYGGRASLAG